MTTVETLEQEMIDRFGPLEPSVSNLTSVMRMKIQLRRLGVRSLSAGKAGFSLVFDSGTRVNAQKLALSVAKYPAHFQIFPDGKLLIKRLVANSNETLSTEKIMRGIEAALSQLETWCE